jgi:dTDP-4-dehydrorhamnose reductase
MDQFLVVGASGFIGRHLFRFLEEQANTETIGTRSRSSDTRLVQFDLATDSIRDCLTAPWRESRESKWAVICSAVVPMDRCATEPDYARAVMLEGTKRCIDQLVEMNFRPVFLSTSYVFDGGSGGYHEDDAPAPQSQYGQLKREMELYLAETCPESLVARLDKTVGADASAGHLFSGWYRDASRQQAIVCIADQQFGPTLVDDVVSLLYRSCRTRLTGIYHLANPTPIPREVLAARFLAECGMNTEIRTEPLSDFNLPEPRPLRSWLNADKICQALDVTFTPVDEILRRFASNVQSGRRSSGS